jgi:hypothetical protein
MLYLLTISIERCKKFVFRSYEEVADDGLDFQSDEREPPGERLTRVQENVAVRPNRLSSVAV